MVGGRTDGGQGGDQGKDMMKLSRKGIGARRGAGPGLRGLTKERKQWKES